MQSFEDARQKDVVHSVATLVPAERSEYNSMQKYLHICRTCSICGTDFRLKHLVCATQSDHDGRDHIDYQTETVDKWFEVRITSNTFHVLNSTGFIPALPPGCATESDGVYCIRRTGRQPLSSREEMGTLK